MCSTTDLVIFRHLGNYYSLDRQYPFLSAVNNVLVLLDISLTCLAALGAIFVLRSAAIGALIFLQLAVAFVLSESTLPFVACSVSVSYYLWNSYSRSFTRKYQDLAINLYEHYEDHYHATDKVKRIPKELFDMACDELMPIRKGIYILVVKTSLSAIFIFLVGSFTTSINASSKMKCLVAFLIGTFPMIVNIYLYGGKQNNNFDLKTRTIANEYIYSKRHLQPGYNFEQGYASFEKDTFLGFIMAGAIPKLISYFCCLFFVRTWLDSR